MTFVEPKSGTLDVNGVRLHTLDWGGAGDPIVLLHATGFLGRIYAPIAAALTRIGHVYSYDQRGHGDSSPAPDGQYNWQLTMEDLAGFITRDGFSRRARVRSFGRRDRDRIAGVRASGFDRARGADRAGDFRTPNSPELGWRNPLIESTLKRKRVFDSVEAMFAELRSQAAVQYLGQIDPARLLRVRHPRQCRGQARAEVQARDRGALTMRPRTISTAWDASCARRFHCWCYSARRAIRWASRWRTRSPRSCTKGRVETVADTGHFMPMEKPADIAQMAIDFLK